MSYTNLKYQLKIKIYKDTPSFGPGVVEIMELVEETGKLSEAYRIMGLSSSKGWKIIKRAEDDLGFPLIISVVGGNGGGSSELTKEGIDILNRYQSFINEVKIDADKAFKKYF
ncbi:winged helix-turn-helix domain-containing protein [Paratissierella segnis]|jgi:molybdate transport system regulatory protein|uniref:ModE family transcriptional regulator n=1 Tax=Paratissierella segnis TaxID=2763679 RepID=A0A926IJF6_9FIRM|nr:molybdenum-binding protein [Paratissierella segnis]MBC8587190.1 ModE family transcriptional regulator [Paratissierella segnis]